MATRNSTTTDDLSPMRALGVGINESVLLSDQFDVLLKSARGVSSKNSKPREAIEQALAQRDKLATKLAALDDDSCVVEDGLSRVVMTAARRFTESEYEQGYEKLTTIFAGIEALRDVRPDPRISVIHGYS